MINLPNMTSPSWRVGDAVALVMVAVASAASDDDMLRCVVEEQEEKDTVRLFVAIQEGCACALD